MLLALVSLAVVVGALRAVNEATFDLVQSVQAPALDLASTVVSVFGGTSLTVAVALGIAVARLRHGRRDAFIPLFIAAVFVVEASLKLLIPEAPPPRERGRGVDVSIIHSPFVNSFPSGHVARFAFLLGIMPAPAWLVAAGVVLMALTRIYLGEHWLSDTIGGAFLGLGVASVARTVR